jgi:uncharacterized protein YlxP (DUF503 family)
MTPYVCVIEIRLHLNDSHDLKGKRKVLHSLKAQVRQRFGASVAEVDGQDTWSGSSRLVVRTGAASSETCSVSPTSAAEVLQVRGRAVAIVAALCLSA